jgi:WD40 repeat protein
MATAPGQIIRLFVSSTFADFSAERTLLQQDIFPALRDLCRQEGFRFQPIDMRWGVSQEAGKIGRTLAICFEELRRCQQLSPDFNLLILLGDRYGSRLLPESIPAEQYARLAPRFTPSMQALFEEVYAEDRNARPYEYVLRPRDGERASWEAAVAETLRGALAQACEQAGFSADEALPYVASTTHQEIWRGLLAKGCDPTSAMCALRTFTTSPNGPSAAPFVEGDPEGRARLASLREAIRERLGDGDRLLAYSAGWRGDEPALDHEALRGQLFALLERRVRAVIGQRQAAPHAAVTEANARFARERTAHFVGRAEVLQTIADELASANGHPLIVTGASGAGKSTLLAEAVRRAEATYPQAVVVTRYIGITPGMSSLRDLLVGLRRELATRYGQEAPAIPTEDAQLIAEFPAALASATAEQPLIVVVDALDQLGAPPQRVDWLPTDLPPHAHVVVSVLSDRPELATLRQQLGAEQFVRLAALARAEGAQLLDHWLADAGRDLQPIQRDAVLSSFAVEGLPLYLRLAFDQARRWRSFEAVPTLAPTIPELLRGLFTELSRDDWHGSVLVAHALGDLEAAKNGLAEDEVLDVLGQDDQVLADVHRLSPDSPLLDSKQSARLERRQLPLPVVLWARLYTDLEPYLTEREADGASLITFYHRQLREVVEDQYVHGEAGIARHQALAHYFDAQPLTLGEQFNRRQLSELPYQQARAELWEALHTTLTNVSFLESKIADQGAGAVVEDLASCAERADIQRISAVIRAGVVVLAKEPDELANQIQGRVGAITTLHDRPERQMPYLLLQSQSLLPADPAYVRSFVGHTKGVQGCAFSPDGRLAISASDDATLRLWDVATGESLRNFVGHRIDVNGCAFSPDGRLALSAADDQSLRLWEVANGETLRIFNGHNSSVQGCAFSPDGCFALSASNDQTLRLWEVATGESVRTFTGHILSVQGCAFSPDGRLALSASRDATLRLWEVASGETLRIFKGHFGMVLGCAFSPDGRLALSASDDATLRLWDVMSGETLRAFTDHTEVVWGCAFSPDGRLALSASADHTLRLWEVATGENMYTFRGHTGEISWCAFSPDGRLALSASNDRTLRLWEVAGVQNVRTWEGHTDLVWSCAFSPDGRLALSASNDHTLRLWDVASGTWVRTFTGHSDYVTGCAFSPDGRLAFSVSRDRTLRLWDVATGENIRAFTGHRGSMTGCAYSPDGRYVLSTGGYGDRTLKLWEVATGENVRTFKGHTSGVVGCAFSPDGHLALSAADDWTLRLWDVASGTWVRTFTGHSDYVTGCAFSPDGRLALSASHDGTLRLWDVASGHTVRIFTGHTDPVLSCAFSPDGKLAITASFDCTLRLWEVASGHEQAKWLTDAWLRCCAFGPDGRRVLAGDSVGGVHFLEVVGVEAGEGAPLTGLASPASETSPDETAVPLASDPGAGGATTGDVQASAPQVRVKPTRGIVGWLRRK